jgi:capsular exopolysaccharide synthesis family protein
VKTSTLSTLIRALLRWWWLIVVAVALGVGVGFFVRTEQPDIYSAKATVLIGQDVRQGDFTGPNYSLTQAYSVLVRRSTVLQPVIDDLQLGVTPEDLNEMLEINMNLQASLLEITVLDTEPERAALIANRIGQELVNQSQGASVSEDQAFINAQLADIQQQITQLQDRDNTLQAEANNITSAFELSQNLAERDQIRTAVQELRTMYADLSNSTGSGARGQVTLFEEAVPSFWPVASNSTLDLILAGAAGGVLAIVTIVLITFFDDRLQWSEGEGATVLDQRVLGPLGVVPANKLPLYMETMPSSVEAEALRQLRSKIFIQADNAHPRIITITSYDSGDGKTLTTANLALAFAQSGLRTLAVDGDLRKGDLHELFRMPNVRGMSDLLASREPLEQVLPHYILDSGLEGLSLLTCGRDTTDPAGLLSKPRFSQLIHLLTQQYDLLVMDSVPTIGGHDAVFLAEVSDGVVIVVGARRTTQNGLKRTIANLQASADVNILGVVFNRVRLQVTSKYSSSYYYRSPARVSPERLNRELVASSKRGLRLRPNIKTDRSGERLYSAAAAASRLGVREKTVNAWIRSGYLKAQRGLLRTWVREHDLNALLNSLPVQDMPAPAAAPGSGPLPVPTAADVTNGAPYLPEQLREQREALLDYMARPPHSQDR